MNDTIRAGAADLSGKSKRRSPMPITAEADEARQRLIVTVPGGTRWGAFHPFVVDLVTTRPALTDWNWIIDDQGPMDDVDVAGMVAIGAAFRRLTADPQRPKFTVTVTTDRFFANWARVIDLHYGVRRHHGAPTVAAAQRLMDQLETRAATLVTDRPARSSAPPRLPICNGVLDS
jgi:hypothetical protein